MSSSTSTNELDGNRVPPETKLFVFDVSQRRIVREIAPVLGAASTGPIIAVTGERVLGLTADPARPGASLLYGVDTTMGEVLFRKPLPWSLPDRWTCPSVTGASPTRAQPIWPAGSPPG